MHTTGKIAPIDRDTERPGFDAKIEFLAEPSSYRERPAEVSVRETHHAWLFLTDRHVFKMKKPSRLGGFDFSSLEARHWLCEEELRLNRRLAADTYLDVVPLALDDRGELELGGDGRTVEWLVKMRRLPDAQALPAAAAADRAPPAEIRKLMQKLRRFYAATARIDFGVGGYAAHLRGRLDLWARELGRAGVAGPDAGIEELLQAQCAYVEANAALLERRAADGCIRDGHGDLRPEHVFLVEDREPEIIDCLEFNADLRRLDSAEEIAFLAMECRHAGLEALERDCVDGYRDEFGEAAAPRRLCDFYAALGATVRAGLAAWRIAASADGDQWRHRLARYLDDARHYMAAAGRPD